MAYNRFTIDGFGQLELNNVAFRRDGRIEAQCALVPEQAENGMALVVDKVKGQVRFSTGSEEKGIIALHYSAEHVYSNKDIGLKSFVLKNDSFLPRMGYLSIGDLFTTNTIGYDTTTFANDGAVKTAVKAVKTTPVYATPAKDGSWELVKVAPTSGVVAEVVKETTMPDGQYAVQLRIIAL